MIKLLLILSITFIFSYCNNLDYNNNYLDKKTKEDITSFTIIYYQSLKLEKSNNFKINTSTKNLSLLISDYYKLDNKKVYEKLEELIINSSTPIKLLDDIKDNFK